MSNLARLIGTLLNNEERFLGGIHGTRMSLSEAIPAIEEWASCFHRDTSTALTALTSCIWQSMVMSLIPAKGIDPTYHGSIDAAIVEHCNSIGLKLDETSIATLRDICLNVRKQHGLNKAASRRLSATLATLRARPHLYSAIHRRQGGRCLWCGVSFSSPDVKETLDHYSPKHIGDDLPTGANWALACETCNAGKADTFAWPASPFAHDFLRREDLQNGHLSKEHRWVILAREQTCCYCKRGTTEVELFVTRRVKTGLLTPSNSSAVCEECAASHNSEIPPVEYSSREMSRGRTSPDGQLEQ